MLSLNITKILFLYLYNKKYNINNTSTCTNCGEHFIIKKPRQINCDECNKNKFNIIIKCNYCNKEFKTNNKSKKYCSDKCLELNKRKVLICKECETEFYGKGNIKYCSIECKNNNKIKNHKITLKLKK